jgi:hypothetical protein
MCGQVTEEVERGLKVQRKFRVRMAEMREEYLYYGVTWVSRSPITGS